MSELLQPALMDMPIAGLYPASPDTVNRLLADWGHRLGEVHRPFTQLGYVLSWSGRPVACAMSGTTVSDTVEGYLRTEVVELTRLCADPALRWATRVMLRLWREVCAGLWPHWKPKAAVSYSHNAMHRGDIYRMDGWQKVRSDAGRSGGGGSHTQARHKGDILQGTKTLWLYRFEEQTTEVAA